MKNGKTLINFRVNESDLIILRERAKANNTSMTGLVLSSIRKATAPEQKKESEITTRVLAEIAQMMHEQNAKIQEQNDIIKGLNKRLDDIEYNTKRSNDNVLRLVEVYKRFNKLLNPALSDHMNRILHEVFGNAK